MGANGNFIVVWGSGTYDYATSGGFAQRFDNNGNPVGAEFRFGDSYSVGGKISVVMAPDGRFVIAWSNLGQITAKRYDPLGNELPPPPGVPLEVGNAFIVKTGPPFASPISRFQSAIAMDAIGNFVIVWEDRTGQDGDQFGIFAKRYDAAGNEIPPPLGVQGAGVGNEFQVNSFTGYRQMTPDVAMNAAGDFIITWWSFLQDGGFDAVMAKRYDSTGNELAPAFGTQGCGVGNEFQANLFHQHWDSQSPGGAGHGPNVAMDASGNFVIAWDGSNIPGGVPHGQDCSSDGVFAKRYDASGNELPPPPGTQGNGIGNEFQVNSRGVNSQGHQDVAMTPDGKFVITWYGYAGQPTARVVAKAFDAAGNVITPPAGSQGNGLCNEFEATTFTAEGFPAVAIAPDGDFIIVWDDSTGADGDFSGPGAPSGIFARRYVGSAEPTPISPLTNEPALSCPPDITVNAIVSGQVTVPDLRSQAVITGVCAPCAAITVTQSPAPGTVVSCGAHEITLTLSDTAGHTSSCTTMFHVVNPCAPTVSVGGVLFRDLNDNGYFEPALGETGIDGVQVQLFRDDGDGVLRIYDEAVTSTATSNNGRYLFPGLAPGDYLVNAQLEYFGTGAPLNGLRSSTGNDPSPDPDDDAIGDDNGEENFRFGTFSGVASRAVTLTPCGEPVNDGDGDPNANLTVDLGFKIGPSVAVGGIVFRDSNNNGRFEPGLGETGIDGVVLNIFRDNGDGVFDFHDGQQGGAVSTNGGHYTFGGLVPGDFFVWVRFENFLWSNGPLYQFLSSTGNDPAPDPDNDVVRDDNGENLDPQGPEIVGVASRAITVHVGTEPGSDGDGDQSTNLTLDFGFVPPQNSGCAYDNTPPSVACPPNVTVAFNALSVPITTATDNCDPNPAVTFVDSAAGICPMIVTRTYTATDASGNVTTCKQIITINNLFATDAIIWHQPLARNGASEDTAPGAGGTLKYRFKLGSTIPIKIHALGCGGTDVTAHANVIGKVDVFGDTNCDGVADGNALPIDYNGVGEAGGTMDKIDGQLKYNLDTKKLPKTTQCYILQVTVTDVSTGESQSETVSLQAK